MSTGCTQRPSCLEPHSVRAGKGDQLAQEVNSLLGQSALFQTSQDADSLMYTVWPR